MKGCLSQRILVLNRLWQAINIIGVKRAFGLLFQDHAKVIHSEESDFLILKPQEWIEYSVANPPSNDRSCIHTVHLKLHIPRVLLLNRYDRLPMKEVKFTRQNLFERDNYTCQYCGRALSYNDLNLDHIIPRDRGGRATWENIVTSCIHCNTRKANRLPHEANMRLLHKPQRPKFRPFISFVIGSEADEVWSRFFS